MQIRLDPPNAAAVRKEALAHRRLFKRKCSFADVVNKLLAVAIEDRRQLIELAKRAKTA